LPRQDSLLPGFSEVEIDTGRISEVVLIGPIVGNGVPELGQEVLQLEGAEADMPANPKIQAPARSHRKGRVLFDGTQEVAWGHYNRSRSN
jgi:hypothetical protein